MCIGDSADALREAVTTLCNRVERRIPIATHELDVAGHAHHPSHARDLEHGVLAQPLHFPREAADQEDVGVGFMIGDDDIRPTRVLQSPPHAEAPPTVESHRGNTHEAKGTTGGVATWIEGGREEPNPRNEQPSEDG